MAEPWTQGLGPANGRRRSLSLHAASPGTCRPRWSSGAGIPTEQAGVTAEGGGVAGHEHQVAGAAGGENGHSATSQPGFGRVRHHHGGRGRTPALHVEAQHLGRGQVDPGVGGRRGRALQDRDRPVVAGRRPEQAHAPIGIDEGAGASPATAALTTSTRASAPRGLAWKNERAETRNRFPAISSNIQARCPASSSSSPTTSTDGGRTAPAARGASSARRSPVAAPQRRVTSRAKPKPPVATRSASRG